MNYATMSSGIEAPSVAWHPLGWTPKWFSEIAPFPCKVLKHHYPQVPNLGDMMALLTNKTFLDEPVDLMAAGTPCQSFSLAGLRGGLSDDRGNLILQYCRILRAKRPKWFIWENVPGALSSFSNQAGSPDLEGTGYENGADITETSDFATILTAFRECGYSCAYRILDAQFFGVPQRRRRIFVVGHFGNDWRPPAAVLFEPNSGAGDFTQIRKKRQDIAGTLESRTSGAGFPGSDGAAGNHIVPWPHEKTGAFPASFSGKQGIDDQHIKGGAPFFIPYNISFNDANGIRKDRPNRGMYVNETDLANAITTNEGSLAIVQSWWDGSQIAPTLDAVLYKGQTMPEKNRFPAILTATPLNTQNFTGRKSDNGRMGSGIGNPGDPQNTISKSHAHAVFYSTSVRRITPLEAERLQGFPDNYTNIPGAKDSPRYKAIGNSMAVPVMAWLGNRIDQVDKFLKTNTI